MPKCFVFLVLSIFALSCSRKVESPTKESQPVGFPVVAAVKVSRQAIDSSLHLVAEFRPYREIDVMAKVSGYVNRIAVDMGDRVTTGQVLATLEIPEMADDQSRAQAAIDRSSAEVSRAREEVRRAESASEMAKLNYDRLSNVARQRPGLLAQQELDSAKARAFEAAAQLAGAKSAFVAAEQGVKVFRAEESRVKTMLNYTRVVAPFPGVITRRYAEVGAMVQAGISSQNNVLPIVRLAQDNLLRLELPIPESAVPFVRVGFPVTIHIPTLSRDIEARIDRFSSQLQLSTRTMTAQIDVTNSNFAIKPGMFAEVNLQFESKPAALAAPLMALDGTGETRRALKILPSGVLTPVNLSIGSESSEYAEILSGLAEGDLLVVSGRSQLKPGATVTPKIVANPGAKQ
jgi:RND family efflux transporter MFP subunit